MRGLAGGLIGWGLMVGLSVVATTLRAQSLKLDFADKAQLINCQPSIAKPAFRVSMNILDAQGSPASVPLANGSELQKALTFQINHQAVSPFYADWRGEGQQVVRGRVALVLIDISGSMNIRLKMGQTRFEAAQAALRQFLSEFKDGVDKVAIVPFESHGVKARIDSTQFAETRDAALQQVAALPRPEPKNNTALYSAVVSGLQVLQKEAGATNGTNVSAPESMLIVMTDGKNEVYKGDDPDLLSGSDGLNQARSAVQTSGIQVIAIGFGDPGTVDEQALQAISRQKYMAENSEQLTRAFSQARTLLNNRITATFPSIFNDRVSLEGKSLTIVASLAGPDGPIQSTEQIWSAPQIGSPSFEGRCNAEELKAALQIPGGNRDWIPIVRPVLVFVGLGSLLLITWFWIPRLVWPEQYIGSFSVASKGKRWVEKPNDERKRGMRDSAKAPPGFAAGKKGVQAPRAPSDETVFNPSLDLTRSRLQKPPIRDKDL